MDSIRPAWLACMLGGLSVITNECYTGVITIGIFTMGVQ